MPVPPEFPEADGLLAIQYWSTTPSKLGPLAMKSSARPVLSEDPAATKSYSKDKLRLAMSKHLTLHEAWFDFMVQIQTDLRTMPVEDPTVRWDESASPFIKVATITISLQSFESAEQMEVGENLSFTPWHSVSDHRPWGESTERAKKFTPRLPPDGMN